MELNILNQFGLQYRCFGEFMQLNWNRFLDIIGDDPQYLWIVGTNVLTLITYWLYAIIFTLMDLTNKPRFLRKYKIQPGQNEPVGRKKLANAIKMVLLNQIFVSLIATSIFYRFTNKDSLRVLPTFRVLFTDLAIAIVLEEIVFYYMHRLLHHRAIYKYVHKKHHEWTAPIAAMTFYCHPVEHVMGNLLPIAVGIGVSRAHITTAWIFIIIAIINSMTDHCGYSFPFSASSVRFHDYHHSKFNYNFGVFGWLDKLQGTFVETANIADKSVKDREQEQIANKLSNSAN